MFSNISIPTWPLRGRDLAIPIRKILSRVSCCTGTSAVSLKKRGRSGPL